MHTEGNRTQLDATARHELALKNANEAVAALQTHTDGLNTDEAKLRFEQYGPNELPADPPTPQWLVFLQQFASPLIYILLVAVAILAWKGDMVDAGIVLAVLVVNAIIGTFQEGRAQKALAALSSLSTHSATVLRGGERLTLSECELVPGDIILLSEGERVAADIRLIDVQGLSIDEAILTGEADPVRKQVDPVNRGPEGQVVPVFQQLSMAFKGTFVANGAGTGVVIGTGLATELGVISQELKHEKPDIPLKRNVAVLSQQIIIAALLLGASLIAYGAFNGKDLSQMFATAVSLMVSIVPEGLPIVLTYVLATGVARMSKRNVLVKKLQAVEALGQAHVIAVDKTGTITRNELAAVELWAGNKHYRIEADGFTPEGRVFQGERQVEQVEDRLEWALRAAALTATATIHNDEKSKRWYVQGEPTEAALAVAARKLRITREELEEHYELLEDTGFDYVAKMRLVLHKSRGKYLISVAGAPEAVLERSGLSNDEQDNIRAIQHEMATRGLRVVAVAHATFHDHPDLKESHHFQLDGLFGMQDSLQPSVQEAVAQVQRAGIRVVMITGDHAATAEAIARQAGIFADGDLVITGAELEKMSAIELQDLTARLSVCARVTPHHKMQIVEAFRAAGRTIAMTGDGVNDAPSLVAADLGIAMGRKGTDVAKEAADLVLMDDNFKSIVAAVEEGRSIYSSIQRVVTYLFAGSGSQVLLIALAILFLFPIPLLPSQIIWLNFVTDSFMVLALAAERRLQGLLDSGYEHPRTILTSRLFRRVLTLALPMSLVTLYVFNHYNSLGNAALASTMALTTLAGCHWVAAWNARSSRRSVFSGGSFLENKALIGMTVIAVSFQLMVIYAPFMQPLFHTVPLQLSDWSWVVAAMLTVLIVDELRKVMVRFLSAAEQAQQAQSTVSEREVAPKSA
jgi:P-type Ca2+ transporter type 2C